VSTLASNSKEKDNAKEIIVRHVWDWQGGC